MPIAYWRDDYLTGVEQVDHQHQHLFQIVNTLHDAMLEGRGHDVLEKTLADLKEYTLEHFAAEEQMMVDYGYPNYEEHRAKHEKLKQDVSLLCQQFAAGKRPHLSIEVSRFLADWLIHHIKEEDQALIRFVREARMKSLSGNTSDRLPARPFTLTR